ncbi:MAG: flavodoxin FldA [Spirochaetales bacterium]|nr:flavodoxin FldA [Spirochaetales bacterium]
MAKIAIIYGSTTGNTQSAAEKIQAQLGSGDLMVADKGALEKLPDYDLIIMGSSTWGFGDLQDDWDSLIEDIKKADLSGKKVAFFGTGDQEGYPDTFVDAMGILEEATEEAGAQTIAFWPVESYNYDDSKAVKGDSFVGLALDDDNQADLTDKRITEWTKLVLDQID